MVLKSVSFASETSTGVSITPDEYSIYCRDSSYRYIYPHIHMINI